MPVDVKVAANLMLECGRIDGVSIDPMKLQKLTYLAQGWHLLFLDNPLIAQEVQAWKYGPVIYDLYTEFKEFKASPITRLAPLSPGTITLTDTQQGLIKSVWSKYKDKSGIYLSMLTHEPGSAWDITRKDCTGNSSSPVIPNNLIRAEFAQRAKRAADSK